MKEMKVRLTFFEDVLGTTANDPDIFKKFIAGNAPDAPSREEEIAAHGVEELQEKGKTVFEKDKNGTPFLWDYQIRGFSKSAAQAGAYIGGKYKLTAYKKKIDLLVFIKERRIPFHIPDGLSTGECQRPLRGQTAQGERVALAYSETVPAGSWIDFTIQVMEDSLMNYVVQWLDYGANNSIGQWRNSGKGRFTWQDISEK